MDARRSGGRHRKPLAAGTFQPEISSFRLALAAEAKAAKTVRNYNRGGAVVRRRALIPQTGWTRWEQVTGQDVQWWMGWLLSRYSDSYASNQYRALQAVLQVAGRRRGTSQPDGPAAAAEGHRETHPSVHQC